MVVLDSLVNVLDTVLYLFQLSLVIYIVISLLIQFGIVNPYSSIISLVQNSLSQIHEPILNIVRKYIPMFGNLDLSPLVVFLLIMFLSDILNTKVLRPAVLETTALGVALLSGYQYGIYKSINEIKSKWKKEAHFNPKINKSIRNNLLQGWQQAIRKTLIK